MLKRHGWLKKQIKLRKRKKPPLFRLLPLHPSRRPLLLRHLLKRLPHRLRLPLRQFLYPRPLPHPQHRRHPRQAQRLHLRRLELFLHRRLLAPHHLRRHRLLRQCRPLLHLLLRQRQQLRLQHRHLLRRQCLLHPRLHLRQYRLLLHRLRPCLQRLRSLQLQPSSLMNL